MEYCFDKLQNILAIKPKVFERKENQAMNSTEYYISCEIFRQITEALNCLHTFKPQPLIHRHLKPENILIGKSGNKRVCKLADFGLPMLSADQMQYHKNCLAEQDSYRAHEVKIEKVESLNDPKADVYSLGVTALEIFDLEE